MWAIRNHCQRAYLMGDGTYLGPEGVYIRLFQHHSDATKEAVRLTTETGQVHSVERYMDLVAQTVKEREEEAEKYANWRAEPLTYLPYEATFSFIGDPGDADYYDDPYPYSFRSKFLMMKHADVVGVVAEYDGDIRSFAYDDYHEMMHHFVVEVSLVGTATLEVGDDTDEAELAVEAEATYKQVMDMIARQDQEDLIANTIDAQKYDAEQLLVNTIKAKGL